MVEDKDEENPLMIDVLVDNFMDTLLTRRDIEAAKNILSERLFNAIIINESSEKGFLGDYYLFHHICQDRRISLPTLIFLVEEYSDPSKITEYMSNLIQYTKYNNSFTVDMYKYIYDKGLAYFLDHQCMWGDDIKHLILNCDKPTVAYFMSLYALHIQKNPQFKLPLESRMLCSQPAFPDILSLCYRWSLKYNPYRQINLYCGKSTAYETASEEYKDAYHDHGSVSNSNLINTPNTNSFSNTTLNEEDETILKYLGDFILPESRFLNAAQDQRGKKKFIFSFDPRFVGTQHFHHFTTTGIKEEEFIYRSAVSAASNLSTHPLNNYSLNGGDGSMGDAEEITSNRTTIYSVLDDVLSTSTYIHQDVINNTPTPDYYSPLQSAIDSGVTKYLDESDIEDATGLPMTVHTAALMKHVCVTDVPSYLHSTPFAPPPIFLGMEPGFRGISPGEDCGMYAFMNQHYLDEHDDGDNHGFVLEFNCSPRRPQHTHTHSTAPLSAPVNQVPVNPAPVNQVPVNPALVPNSDITDITHTETYDPLSHPSRLQLDPNHDGDLLGTYVQSNSPEPVPYGDNLLDTYNPHTDSHIDPHVFTNEWSM